ncbi:MAG: hypothetical protein ACKOXB_09505 [Flavobacteriales bacterium]
MNKLKLISYIALVLLLTNILLLCFIFSGKPQHHGPPNIREEVIEKLKLSEQQVVLYDESIQWHQQEIMKAEKEMMRLKSQLYQGISAGDGERKKDSLLMEIAQIDIQIERIHYYHFQDIKALCSVKQKEEFEKLICEIIQHLRPLMKRKHPAGEGS